MRTYLLLAGLLATGADAQVYRCGNEWSQVPCGAVVAAPRPAARLVQGEQLETDLRACQAAVRERLVDPESAQFGEVPAGVLTDGRRQYNLTVNARNRFGGFAGRRMWVCAVDVATGKVLRVHE